MIIKQAVGIVPGRPRYGRFRQQLQYPKFQSDNRSSGCLAPWQEVFVLFTFLVRNGRRPFTQK